MKHFIKPLEQLTKLGKDGKFNGMQGAPVADIENDVWRTIDSQAMRPVSMIDTQDTSGHAFESSSGLVSPLTVAGFAVSSQFER